MAMGNEISEKHGCAGDGDDGDVPYLALTIHSFLRRNNKNKKE